MALRDILKPFSLAYELGEWWTRHAREARRFRSRLPVISVGNLSVGGSGKTPLVIRLAEHLQQQGRHVLVLSRGHGRRSRNAVVWRKGPSLPDPARVGDEPALIARSLDNGALGIAADRSILLRDLEAEFSESVVILDDGFQHHQLDRLLDLVIVDERTVQHPKLLPAGDLREKPQALRRASIVVAVSDAAERFARHWMADEASLYRVEGHRERLIHWRSGAASVISDPVILVTGIARPQRVIDTLNRLGIAVQEHHVFRDHHAYRPRDIDRILASKQRNRVRHLVTTSKDAVKLERFAAIADDLLVVESEPVIADESRLLAEVTSRMDSALTQQDTTPTE